MVQKEFSERQHHRALVRDTSGQARECSPENKECYSFIVKKKKWGSKKTTFFFTLGYTSRFISLVPPLALYGLTGIVMESFKSRAYQQKSGDIY